jgi:hypothetical protein
MAGIVLGAVLTGWQVWLLLTFGLVSAAVGLFCGRAFFGKRRSETAPGLVPTGLVKQAPLPGTESGSERRVFPRYETRQCKLVVSAGENDLVPLEGLVLNRSMGGVCVWVSRAFESGKTLRVRNAEFSRTPWVPLLVKNCRIQRGGWALGCQFVDGPSASTHLFGQ